MRLVFDHSELLAPGIRSFAFMPERPVDYLAGQYAEFHLPHAGTDERGDTRWFTLSSAPSEVFVRIATKLAQEKGSSFKRALLALKPGAKIVMAEPMGDFVLPKDQSIPLVFIAGGIGITPMRSMVQWLHDSGERRNVTLIHHVHTNDELVFAKLFAATPGVVYVPVATQPSPSWRGEAGNLGGERILALAPVASNPQALLYFSGPEPLVENLIADVKRHGIEPRRIVMDYFPGYSAL